jgi:hypothetical protein
MTCPYCGEPLETEDDLANGDHQDCYYQAVADDEEERTRRAEAAHEDLETERAIDRWRGLE